MTIRKDDPDYIHCLLINNDRAVERALLAIFARQTQSEQSSGTTNESNGVGLSACDAPLATYWVKWLRSGRHLSGKHLDKARVMMRKYVRQLADIASDNLERQAIQNQ